MTFENIVSILLTLLAFAMISERISELLKKSILPLVGRLGGGKRNIGIPTGFWGTLAALNTRIADQPAYEEKREQIILPLSVLVGIGVAGVCWNELATLLKLLKTNINPVLGSILAGVLFSFGSKFWHDVLDLVLAIKNIRRNHAHAEVGAFSSASSWSAYLNKDEKALAESVILGMKEELMKQYTSALVELSPILIRNPQGGYQYVVAAYFKEKRPSGFPEYFQVPGSNNWLPVQYFENLGLPRAQRSPGYMVRNTRGSRWGSFGCLLELDNGQRYILTCAHVLVEEPGSVDPQEVLDAVRVLVGGTNETLPVVRYEFGGTKGLDFALLGPVDERYSNTIVGAPTCLNAIRAVSHLDEHHIFSAALARHATIVEHASVLKKSEIAELEVLFQDGTIHCLKNLIRMERVTKEGDSGSVVYDAQGDVIGMVVAADEHFTYLIQLHHILEDIANGVKIAP